MKQVLAIGGRPGTGKSTLIKKLMNQYTDWVRIKPFPLVDAEYSKEADLVIIGKYDEGEVFGGTDKLSMATQPKALEYIATSHDIRVIFEGDRLFNGSFLRDLMEVDDIDLKVLLLKAKEKTLTERYKERGTEQSEQFLNSRQTKYDNMLMSFDLMDLIQERTNENLENQNCLLEEILEFFDIFH